MSSNWYYVENNERVGPIDEKVFLDLIGQSKVTGHTYVWRKGFENWTLAKDLEELKNYLDQNEPIDNSSNIAQEDVVVNSSDKKIYFSWDDIDYYLRPRIVRYILKK